MNLQDFITECTNPRHKNANCLSMVNGKSEVLSAYYYYGWVIEVWEEDTGLLWLEYNSYDDKCKLTGLGTLRSSYPFQQGHDVKLTDPSPVAYVPLQVLRQTILTQIRTGQDPAKGIIWRLISPEEYQRRMMYVYERNVGQQRQYMKANTDFRSDMADVLLFDKRCWTDRRLHLMYTPCVERMFLKKTELTFFSGNGQSNFISPYILAHNGYKNAAQPYQRFYYPTKHYHPSHFGEEGLSLVLRNILSLPSMIYSTDQVAKKPSELIEFITFVLEQAARYMAYIREAVPVAVIVRGGKSPSVIIKQAERFSLLHVFDRGNGNKKSWRTSRMSRKFLLESIDAPTLEWRDVMDPSTDMLLFQGWLREQVLQVAGEQVLFGGL